MADDIEWVSATNTTTKHLEGRAVIGGHEEGDGSPLWVIRSPHQNELIPGKLKVMHALATVPYAGNEISVQNLEVLCAPPGQLSWVRAFDRNVPPKAIAGGNTANGEPLYICRARHEMSVTPGKLNSSNHSCVITYGGKEVTIDKMFEILCRV